MFSSQFIPINRIPLCFIFLFHLTNLFFPLFLGLKTGCEEKKKIAWYPKPGSYYWRCQRHISFSRNHVIPGIDILLGSSYLFRPQVAIWISSSAYKRQQIRKSSDSLFNYSLFMNFSGQVLYFYYLPSPLQVAYDICNKLCMLDTKL